MRPDRRGDLHRRRLGAGDRAGSCSRRARTTPGSRRAPVRGHCAGGYDDNAHAEQGRRHAADGRPCAGESLRPGRVRHAHAVHSYSPHRMYVHDHRRVRSDSTAVDGSVRRTATSCESRPVRPLPRSARKLCPAVLRKRRDSLSLVANGSESCWAAQSPRRTKTSPRIAGGRRSANRHCQRRIAVTSRYSAETNVMPSSPRL